MVVVKGGRLEGDAETAADLATHGLALALGASATRGGVRLQDGLVLVGTAN